MVLLDGNDTESTLRQSSLRETPRFNGLLYTHSLARCVDGKGKVIVANSLYHLANDATVMVISGLFPLLTATLGFNREGVGFLTSAALVVTVLFQMLFGYLSDRYRPERMMPLGVTVLGLGALATTLSFDYGTLFLFVTISRIGASFYHPVGIGWISKEYNGIEKDRAMGYQSSFGDLGVILGITSSGMLGFHLGWRAPFYFWGSVNLAAASVGYVITRGQRQAKPSTSASGRKSLLRLVPWIFPLAVSGAVFTIVTNFGPLYFFSRFNLREDFAALAVGLWIVSGGIAAFSFGTISKRLGRFRALTIAVASLTLGMVIISLSPQFEATFVVLATLGSTLFVMYPALFSFVSDATGERLQGSTFGLVFAFQLLGGVLSSPIVGSLWERWREYPIPFMMAAALSAVCLGYVLSLRKLLVTGEGAPSHPVPIL